MSNQKWILYHKTRETKGKKVQQFTSERSWWLPERVAAEKVQFCHRRNRGHERYFKTWTLRPPTEEVQSSKLNSTSNLNKKSTQVMRKWASLISTSWFLSKDSTEINCHSSYSYSVVLETCAQSVRPSRQQNASHHSSLSWIEHFMKVLEEADKWKLWQNVDFGTWFDATGVLKMTSLVIWCWFEKLCSVVVEFITNDDLLTSYYHRRKKRKPRVPVGSTWKLRKLQKSSRMISRFCKCEAHWTPNDSTREMRWRRFQNISR